MCAYLSKSESECSVVMKQAVQNAFQKERDNYEQVKSAVNKYINKKECSIQECAHHILLGQWLLCLNEYEIFELPEDSKKIIRRNAVDRYIDRPNTTSSGGKFAVLDALSFAEFSDTIIYLQIHNIKKMITNQENLTMNQYQVFLTKGILIPSK